MPKSIKIAGSIVATALGFIWLALDVIGTLATAVDLLGWVPQWVQKLAAREELAYQIGPWFLMGLGFLSLLVIHFWPAHDTTTKSPVLRNDATRPLEQSAVPPAQIAISPDGLISLNEAARLLYEAARSKGHLLASAAERMSGNNQGRMAPGTSEDVLDYMATYIGQEACLWGSRPPSEKREVIPPKLSRFGAFEGGALVLKTDRDAFTDLVIDKNDLFKIIVDLGDVSSGTGSNQSQIPDSPSSEQLQNEAHFQHGFNPDSEGTRKATVLLLARLRNEGVALRNDAAGVVDSTLDDWLASIHNWLDAVVDGLELIDQADAEIFRTLDVVGRPRVDIFIKVINPDRVNEFIRHYRMHDLRVSRLWDLLQKYQGVKFNA